MYLAARSPEKGNAAIQKLSQETGKNALFLQLDLGDLASVKRAAEDYKRFAVLFISSSNLTLCIIIQQGI